MNGLERGLAGSALRALPGQRVAGGSMREV